MLNLLKADLYRITRPRGLRGSLGQYGLAILLVYVFVYAMFALLNTPGLLYDAGDPAAASYLTFASPTQCLSEMTLGIVPLCAAYMTVELGLSDFKNGYIRSVVSARRGRLSYIGEKILMSAVIAAIVIMVASVIVLAASCIEGATFAQADTPAAIAAWFLGMWLNCWALGALSLILVYSTRISPVSYIASFCFCMGTVPQTLMGIAQAGSVLHFIQPIAPALETLAAWMPTSALSNLEHGGSTLLGVGIDLFSPGSGAFVIDPAVQIILTGVIWIALASALVLTIARRHDI